MSDTVDKVVRSTEPETILNMGRELRPIMSELAMKKMAKWFDVPSPNGEFSQPDAAAPTANGGNGAPPSPIAAAETPDSAAAPASNASGPAASG